MLCRRTAVAALALLLGCETPRRTQNDTRNSYPIERSPPPTSVVTKDEDPTSEVWPLDLWLVEFAKRNGVDLHYRDQDTVNHTVIRPSPGPFDSDEQAIAVLRQVARRNGLFVTEEKAHVFALKRSISIR